MDDGGLVGRVLHPVHQGFEELEVLLIQGTMGAQVAHRLGRQSEPALDLIRHRQGDGDAGSLQHLYHAEETHGIAPLDLVVEEGHHQLDGQTGLAVAHRLGIPAAGADVA